MANNEMDIWCDGECGTDDAHFYDDNNRKVYSDRDGQTYTCSKHHWACAECGKIVQVG